MQPNELVDTVGPTVVDLLGDVESPLHSRYERGLVLIDLERAGARYFAPGTSLESQRCQEHAVAAQQRAAVLAIVGLPRRAKLDLEKIVQGNM